ncbi:hypothetical protein L21SP2_2431 [Salinispira pacifica]|uniref:Dihydroneopterin aldolase/epimerase domain-containing protein n=1 Tax=Salinispira pacifica TaxID=1307761 RepID=V5WJN5_9SPIO|nr:hypothetical protein L21SP2_2431 [Salinispira pacifica]
MPDISVYSDLSRGFLTFGPGFAGGEGEGMMIMTVGFQGLKISCIIGILEHERLTAQDIFCDLQVDIDVSPGAGISEEARSSRGSSPSEYARTENTAAEHTSDELSSTLDYRGLAEFAANFAVQGKYGLLENLAEDMISALQQRHPRIRSGMLEIRKPHAIADAEAALIRVKW